MSDQSLKDKIKALVLLKMKEKLNKIYMPKKDFVEEHTKLLDVLKHPTKEKLKDEYDEQSKELAEELDKGANGDWRKEGYKIKVDPASTYYGKPAIRVIAHHPKFGQIGEAHFANEGSHLRVLETEVHPDHQRKGLNSAMYDNAEKHTGLQITPEESDMSGEAKKFWNHRLQLSELDKSNYGPAALDLYNHPDNAKRKASRTGEEVSIGPNKAVRLAGPTRAQAAELQARIDRKKSKQNPVKVYSKEERQKLAQEKGVLAASELEKAPAVSDENANINWPYHPLEEGEFHHTMTHRDSGTPVHVIHMHDRDDDLEMHTGSIYYITDNNKRNGKPIARAEVGHLDPETGLDYDPHFKAALTEPEHRGKGLNTILHLAALKDYKSLKSDRRLSPGSQATYEKLATHPNVRAQLMPTKGTVEDDRGLLAFPQDTQHELHWKPNKKLAASEELDKGVNQRLFPFNPRKDVSEEAASDAGIWQRTHHSLSELDSSYDDHEFHQQHRENIPRFEGAIRHRMLNKLSSATLVRKNPESGKREFLLYRGASPSEMRSARDKHYVQHESPSSWTPHRSQAESFASTYSNEENKKPLAAWISESDIHAAPHMFGHLTEPKIDRLQNDLPITSEQRPGQNVYHKEHEIIVSPHTSDRATKKDVANHDAQVNKLYNPGKMVGLDQRINLRGQDTGSKAYAVRPRSDKKLAASEDLEKAPVVDELYAASVNPDFDIQNILKGYSRKNPNGVHTTKGRSHTYHWVPDSGGFNPIAYVKVQNGPTSSVPQGPYFSSSWTHPDYRNKGISKILHEHAANYHGGVYSDTRLSPGSNAVYGALNADLAPIAHMSDDSYAAESQHFLPPSNKSEDLDKVDAQPEPRDYLQEIDDEAQALADNIKPDWKTFYTAQDDGTDTGLPYDPDHEHPIHGSYVNDIPMKWPDRLSSPLHENQLPENQLKIALLNAGILAYHPEKGYHKVRRFVDRGDSHPMFKAEPGQKIKLVHYSRKPGLKVLEPSHIGSGVGSRTERNAEVPRTYFYREGTETEPLVTGGAVSKYTTSIDPAVHKLYDLSQDPDKHVEATLDANHGAWNTDAILKRIRDYGYHGYFNSRGALPDAVALFHPHPVEREEELKHG